MILILLIIASYLTRDGMSGLEMETKDEQLKDCYYSSSY